MLEIGLNVCYTLLCTNTVKKSVRADMCLKKRGNRKLRGCRGICAVRFALEWNRGKTVTQGLRYRLVSVAE